MMQGPRMPFRGSMPPHLYRGGMPQQPFMGPMQGRPPMIPNSPMMGRGFRAPGGPSQMRQGGGGGLLAKLFGRGNQAPGMTTGAMQSASRAVGSGASSSGGILKSLSNPGAINGFLTNTQKVLSTAQQFGPMIQQYGPIVKNIPSMWKLYKGLTNSTDETAEENKTEKDKKNPTNKTIKEKKKEIAIDEQPPLQKVKKEYKGQSRPKLYI